MTRDLLKRARAQILSLDCGHALVCAVPACREGGHEHESYGDEWACSEECPCVPACEGHEPDTCEKATKARELVDEIDRALSSTPGDAPGVTPCPACVIEAAPKDGSALCPRHRASVDAEVALTKRLLADVDRALGRTATPPRPPSEGARPTEVQEVTDEGGEPVAYFTRERVNAVAFERLMRDSRFTPDYPDDLAEEVTYEWWRETPCECGDHGCHYEVAVPTDPDAFAVTVWHVEGRGWLGSGPAPAAPASPAPSTSTAERIAGAWCSHGVAAWARCLACEAAGGSGFQPAPSTSRDDAPRSHRCIDDGGDGYECPGCHAGEHGATARDAALEEAAEVISHILDTNAHGSGRAALAVARVRIRSLKGQPAPAEAPTSRHACTACGVVAYVPAGEDYRRGVEDTISWLERTDFFEVDDGDYVRRALLSDSAPDAKEKP